MADFGEATFVLTKHMKQQLLVYEIPENPGFHYVFEKKSSKILSNGAKNTYFVCRGCILADNTGAKSVHRARVTVCEGRLMTNPRCGHAHNCRQIPMNELEARKVSQEARWRCRKEARRPMTAYLEAVSSLRVRYTNEANQHKVEDAIPSYKRIRRSLYRHANHTIIPIRDANNLPQPYTLTLQGREALAKNAAANVQHERFLLYKDKNMMVFMSDADVDVVLNSEYLTGNGTFDRVPKQFCQLYTIHGFKRGEAVPVCYALLCNKQRSTYHQMFMVIRDALINRHGDLGVLHTVVMDFDPAAHDAARAVFQAQTIACFYDFCKRIQQWLHHHSLMEVYETNAGGTKEWIRYIKALVLLPPTLVAFIWKRWLRYAPLVDNPLHQRNLEEFVQYFENTWVYGMIPLNVWNHFDNVWRFDAFRRGLPGPRTTNHADGWNDKLNQDTSNQAPSLATFLHRLQCAHHAARARISQLDTCVNPCDLDPRQEMIDQAVCDAKRIFLQRRAYVPIDIPEAEALLVGEIQQYLQHVATILAEY